MAIMKTLVIQEKRQNQRKSEKAADKYQKLKTLSQKAYLRKNNHKPNKET